MKKGLKPESAKFFFCRILEVLGECFQTFSLFLTQKESKAKIIKQNKKSVELFMIDLREITFK